MDSRQLIASNLRRVHRACALPRARSATSLVLLFSAILFFTACGDDPAQDQAAAPPAAVDATPYLGRYKVTPSARGESLVLFRDGSVVYRDEFSEQQGQFQIDRRMLRIYLTSPTEPTGVFLLTAFHRQNWRGLWEGQVRFLQK